MESKETAEEALAVALKAGRSISLPGSDWNKQANHLVARNVLHSELGMYADNQPIYNLDQETRDRLLVHARQDAAEAMCHARSLVDDIHQLKSALRGFNLTIVALFAAYLLWSWWKSGFAIWSW
jgi:hypothetical protein